MPVAGEPGDGLCASCGLPLSGSLAGDHRRCALDPPRFCPHCGRRLKVQVFPLGYRAACPVCDRSSSQH